MGTDPTRPGPTGEFPDGTIGPEDKGELAVAVAHDQDRVVLDFGTPTLWIAMDPDEARGLASLLLRHARALDGRGPILESFRPRPGE